MVLKVTEKGQQLHGKGVKRKEGYKKHKKTFGGVDIASILVCGSGFLDYVCVLWKYGGHYISLLLQYTWEEK